MDILELSQDSSEGLYAKAVKGAQAIVFCEAFRPTSKLSDAFAISNNILDLCEKAAEAKVSAVKKVVVLSRYMPVGYPSSGSGNPLQLLAGGLLSLVTGGGEGAPADSAVFGSFREAHRGFEDRVRDLSRRRCFEHVVVRAPGLVESSRAGVMEWDGIEWVGVGWDGMGWGGGGGGGMEWNGDQIR